MRSVELELIEAGQVIGTAELYVFNADGADTACESMHEMCDAHSQTTYNCGLAVYHRRGWKIAIFEEAARTLDIPGVQR